jgi:hypothetical protein
MSYVVAHMEKMKAGNLNGVSIHDERRTKGHSNQDIDVSRTHLNYDLVTNRNGTLQQDIKNYINNNKAKNALVRKDSVLVNEWVISSDQEFFKKLSEQKTKEYFEATKEYFGQRFGDQNIRYAIVHLDETTPHLHMGIVPFDEKNKLSSKRVFDRKALRDVQNELPKFLQERGFRIERGIRGSQNKNMSAKEYKAIKEQVKAEVEQENYQKKLQQSKAIVIDNSAEARYERALEKLARGRNYQSIRRTSERFGRRADELRESHGPKTGNYLELQQTTDMAAESAGRVGEQIQEIERTQQRAESEIERSEEIESRADRFKRIVAERVKRISMGIARIESAIRERLERKKQANKPIKRRILTAEEIKQQSMQAPPKPSAIQPNFVPKKQTAEDAKAYFAEASKRSGQTKKSAEEENRLQPLFKPHRRRFKHDRGLER